MMIASLALAQQLQSKLRIMVSALRGVDIGVQAQRMKAYRKSGLECVTPEQDAIAVDLAMADQCVTAFAQFAMMKAAE